MATNIQPQATRVKKINKFLLGGLFTDAPVRVEPEEPQKVVVAGLVEARPVKDYPDANTNPFRRAMAVARGEMMTLFKASLYFIAFTLPFILVLAVASGYFEDYVLGGLYNFMGDIGVGYPGGGDSIAASTARLYWDVYQPIMMMLAGALIIGSFGMAGHFYCAKRSYFQDYYKRITRTFWIGFAKYWWKFIVTATVGVLIMLAMGTSVLYLLQQQVSGLADAGAYCIVVFTFLIGAPLLTIPMVMISLFASYQLTFVQAFKNALVIVVNCPLVVAVVGVVSLAPILLCIGGKTIAIIAYIAMAIVGFNFLAVFWTSMATRCMNKCHMLKMANNKVEMQSQRRSGKTAKSGNGKKNAAQNVNPYAEKKAVDGTVTNAAPKKKPQQKPAFQNPKKKKKKK